MVEQHYLMKIGNTVRVKHRLEVNPKKTTKCLEESDEIMTKLEVIVEPDSTGVGNLTIRNGKYVTVWIPESNHDNSIRIVKEFKHWRAELIHQRPGYGKPYLLELTNHDKGDKIKISVVPHRDFTKTNLVDCTFKSLKQFTLNGPNITTNKSQTDKTQSGMKLELISRGTSRIGSHPLQVNNVLVTVVPIKQGCLDAGDIYVDSQAMLKCSTFKANIIGEGNVFINGVVTCGLFNEEQSLKVKVKSGDVHVNIDGKLGQVENKADNSKNENQTKILHVEIENGSLTNFGSLAAQDYIKLRCNNLLLCSESRNDTAHRGFNSYVSIQKELGFVSDIAQSPKEDSSFSDDRMLRAIENMDSDAFISTVNHEIDPAVKISGRRVQDEFIAVKGRRQNRKDGGQYKKEIIRNGLIICEWRHGIIKAGVIECIVNQDIYDCSQLQGNNVIFDVGGSVRIIKPWTWISGSVSGVIKGNLVFDDNAMLVRFTKLQVQGNVKISKTSVVWIKQGGELFCDKALLNENLMVSEDNLILNLGVLEQRRDGGITCNEDLLLALHDDQEGVWYGYVLVEGHFFIQLSNRVSTDAELIATECDIEFFGRNSQLIINQILIVTNGDLNVEAKESSEVANLVLAGKLHAEGINGISASFYTMPGASAELMYSQNRQKNAATVDVITKWMEISVNSVITYGYRHYNDNNNIIDFPISVRVSCQENLTVHGTVKAIAAVLAIQAKLVKNTGAIMLIHDEKIKTFATSSLLISVENTLSNTGVIECDGNMNIKPETLSNEKGVIKSSLSLGIQAKSFTNSGEIMSSHNENNTGVSSSSLCITCKEKTSNSGTIQCYGNMIIKTETMSNENGAITSPSLFIDAYSSDATALSGRIYVDECMHVRSLSQKEFYFSAVGGKDQTTFALTEKIKEKNEIADTFVLPDEVVISCEKGRLVVDSKIACSDPSGESSQCLLRINECIQVLKESHLGNLFLEFYIDKGGSSDSLILLQDHFSANYLSVCYAKGDEIGDENGMIKQTVQFQGSGQTVNVHILGVHESITEVRFDTQNLFHCSKVILQCELAVIVSEFECVNLEANSLQVEGSLRCITPSEEENQSTFTANKIKLTGDLECAGSVEINAVESFVQETQGSEGIIVREVLKIVAGEKGIVHLAGSTNGQTHQDSKTALEIEGQSVKVSGSITNVTDLKLTAEIHLGLTEESKISTCKAVEIKGEWLTLAGLIEGFETLQIEPWAVLNSGTIHSDLEQSNVRLSSDLALVNSGICKGHVTSLEAPFLLSLPGREIDEVSEVRNCELIGKQRIKLESIACFLGGSSVTSNKLVENNTVLLFKFVAYVASTPDSKSLQAWAKAAESLKRIQSDYADRNKENGGIFELFKSLTSTSSNSAQIDLKIAQTYSMVNMFVADVLNSGIESFDVPRLVFIITSESERFTKINILKEKLLAIPHEAKKIRQWMKNKGIKGYKSIMKRFGFSESKRKSDKGEGVIESGKYSFSEGATITDSSYEAYFDEFYRDEGFLSAGDVFVASKDIIMSKREKSAITMVMLAERVCEAGDIESDSLVIKSEENAKLVGKMKANDATIDAKSGVDLSYHDKSKGKKTADHHFKNLKVKTNKVKEVNDLLKGEGIYEDLRISDRLDLAVTDQDIILSRCNIDQRYQLKLQAKSVQLDEAHVHFEKGASIKSDTNLHVRDSSVSSRGSTVLQSTGDVSMHSSHVGASNVAAVVSDKGSLSMTAGSVCGDERVLLKAEKDVTIDEKETFHGNSQSDRGFFSSSSSSCSYSTVSGANISSKSGSVSVISEEGSVNMTAVDINSGKDLTISAKDDVLIQDKVTTQKEVHVKRNWFRNKTSTKITQVQHKSKLKSGGSMCITSRNKSVFMIGTDVQAGGYKMVRAAERVLFEDRILSSYEESHSSGFSLSFEKGLSYEEESKRTTKQRLAGCGVNLGGNLIVSAKHYNVKNAMPIDAENMMIDAKTVHFEGAELHNTSFMTKWSLDVGLNQLEVSAGEGRSKERKAINQNINVRGKTHIDAEQVNLTACNLNTSSISGQIKELNIVTKQSEIESYENSTSIGFTFVEGIPVPSKFGSKRTSDVGRFVEKSSGIHCTGSINQNEFKVDNMSLKGSSVTAEGKIENFAKSIVSEKIHSYRCQSTSGFEIGATKSGGEFSMCGSKKYIEMEHHATVGSSSGAVCDELKNTVNTDLSKQAKITAQHSSAFGINLAIKKDGAGAGFQSNDTSVGFSATKKQVGLNFQHGDKGIAVCGGKSGVIASIQDGENNVGLGLSKQSINVNVETKHGSIGGSLGKDGASANVKKGDLEIGGSISRNSKSFSVKKGDFETGVSRNKDAKTGHITTAANVQKGDFGLSGSTSRNSKSFGVNKGDFKTEVSRNKDAQTGHTRTAADFQKGDFGLSGSTSKNSKSFGVNKGDFKTEVSRNKDAKTGHTTTATDFQKGDFGLSGSTSKNSKSFGVNKGDFKTKVSRNKDAKTGHTRTAAEFKKGDFGLSGSTSKNSKSFGVNKGEFKTGVSRNKDVKTGHTRTAANVQKGDFGLSGSTSKNSKSSSVKNGDFETGVSRNKDVKTGHTTTDANVQKGDFAISVSNSKDSTSLDIKKGDFETGFSLEKDKETGQTTKSASIKRGDLAISGSTSENAKLLDVKKGDFETRINHERDAETGKTTTAASIKKGDLAISGCTSENAKSLDVKKGDFETRINHERDAETGKTTTAANMKKGDLAISGSTSENAKSLDVKKGDFESRISQERDAETGKTTTAANMKKGDLAISASTSENAKSLDVKKGDFETRISQEFLV